MSRNQQTQDQQPPAALPSGVNIHSAYMPIYLRCLRTNLHLITAARAHLNRSYRTSASGSNGQSSYEKAENALLARRLAPDMNPLGWQVHRVCRAALNIQTIVLGRDALAVSHPDTPQTPMTTYYRDEEYTIAILEKQIKQTIGILEQLTEDEYVGKDTTTVFVAEISRHMLALEYMQDLGMMNLTFHTSMVFALLRNAGVPIGKWDYLGQLRGQPWDVLRGPPQPKEDE